MTADRIGIRPEISQHLRERMEQQFERDLTRLEEQRLMPSTRAGQVTVTIGVEALEQLIQPLQEWAENLRRQFEHLAAAMGLSAEQFLAMLRTMQEEDPRPSQHTFGRGIDLSVERRAPWCMEARGFRLVEPDPPLVADQMPLPVFYPIEGEPGIDAYSGPVSVDIDECWREDCDAEVSRDDDVGLCDSCKAELKEM